MQPFCLDATEATVAELRRVRSLGRCTPAATTVHVPGAPEEAQAKWNVYCNGGSILDHRLKSTRSTAWPTGSRRRPSAARRGKRLPTEQEWEWAARAGARAWDYPWGMAAPRDQLCWSDVAKRESTCEVGRFPQGDTPEGIHDLSGNVWEMTASSFDGVNRVGKWGGWDAQGAPTVRATNRDESEPTFRSAHNTGFRCARA